jgi:hypothetical protein
MAAPINDKKDAGGNNDMADDSLTAAEAARVLAGFADAIFPGDDLFPPAATVGAQGVMATRLRERLGSGAPERLAAALAARGGRDDPAGAAARLEAEDYRLFDTARAYLTFAYYESPPVIAAIRALGHTYNDAPQPNGYAMRPVDAAHDVPATPRGAYVATEAVVRVDLSGLDFLRVQS